MTEQEMQAIFEKMRTGVALTADENKRLAESAGFLNKQFRKLDDAIVDTAATIKKELPAAIANSAKDTAKASGKLAIELGDAAKGFQQLTPIIDAAAKAFSGIPILSGAVAAAAEASKFMLAQLQNATDAFNNMSKVGALTAEGMSGVRRQFIDSGLTLAQFQKSVAANANALANMTGSVGDGAKKFSQVSKIMTGDFGNSLRRLGVTADEIGEQTADYMARQTRLGLAQGKTNEQLAAGAQNYIRELDELAKLTGASKADLKKQQDEALSEARFRAKIDEMRASGDAKQIAQAENLIKTQSLVSAENKALGRAFRDSVSGYVGNSQEAVMGFQATGGALTDIAKNAKTADPTDTLNSLRGAVQANLPLLRSQAMFGNEFAGAYSGLSDFSTGIKKSGEAVRNTQRQQEEGTDKLTNQTVDAMRSMQEMSRNIQDLGFKFMPQASKAVQAFTGAMNKLLKLVNEKVGTNVNYGGDEGTAGTSDTTPPGGTANERRRNARQANATRTGANAPPPDLDSGPVFGRQDTTKTDKIQLTLEEIREEIKKLVKMGALAGGTADLNAAMNAHDRSHQHEPPTITPDAAQKLGEGMGSPLKNLRVTSGFGMRTDPFTGKQAGHGGVDLAGKIGDAIMAPESGIARVVGEAQSGGYGNMVEILNEQGKVIHRLAHMSETMIKTGDKITAGAEIGKVGSTGRSTGAHLHWEQFDPTTGKQVDPLAMLAAKQGQPGMTTASARPGAAPGATDMSTYMKTVAMLESGGDPNARAKTSTAGGLFGFLEGSWKGLGGQNVQDRFDPAKSAEMMAKFSAQQKVQMEKGLGRQVSGADLYMGHFLGGGGATKFLKAKDQDPTASAAKFDPAAAAANKSIFYNKEGGERSMEEVYQLMTEKYRKQEANVMSGNIPALVAGLSGGNIPLGASPTATAMAGPTAPIPAGVPAGDMSGALPASIQTALATGFQNISAEIRTMAGGASGSAETNTLLTQLVSISRDQNSTLGRILQTSQA